MDNIGGNTREMISDCNSSFRFRNFVRVRNERNSPASYARRVYVRAGLIIGFNCTIDNEVSYLFYPVCMKQGAVS